MWIIMDHPWIIAALFGVLCVALWWTSRGMSMEAMLDRDSNLHYRSHAIFKTFPNGLTWSDYRNADRSK